MRELSQSDQCRLSQNGIAGARTKLILALDTVIRENNLSQVSAARLLQTDQPTLSKVLRGRTERVTLDKLMEWLMVLGRSLEIHVVPSHTKNGAIVVLANEHVEA